MRANRAQIDLAYWAQNNCVNEKSAPIELKQHKYLKELYSSYSDEIIVKKSAQVGISTYALLKLLWLAEFNNISAIYTMPKTKDISDFSQARIDPIIKHSKLIGRLNVDNVGLKQIGNSFIYFRGTWGEGEAISVPADILVHDEIDRSKSDIIEMYSERLSASKLKWKIMLSTPTYPNFGITSEYEKTNKKTWIVLCPAGHKQILRASNIKDNKYICKKCGKLLDRTNGKWEKQGRGSIEGYHITQLMAPWISAKEVKKKQNVYKFKRDYFNFVLGEEYAGGEGLVNRADIISCISKFDSIGKARNIMGVDWGDITWILVRELPSKIIYINKIEGDTRTHARQVMEYMDKFHADCVADFGYGDTKNKEIIDKMKHRIWMCVYADKVIYPRFKEKDRIINIDRTRSIQESLLEIKQAKLKIMPQDMIEEFIRHHLNITETKEEDKHGSIRTVISRTGEDHLVHANNYSRLLQSLYIGQQITEEDTKKLADAENIETSSLNYFD